MNSAESSLYLLDVRIKTLDLMILRRLLQYGEQCSTELVREVEQFAARPRVQMIILPLLWKMQQAGLIAGYWQVGEHWRHKWYRVTEMGLGLYQQEIAELDAVLRELQNG